MYNGYFKYFFSVHLIDKCTKNCLIFDTNYLAWETPGVGKYFVFMAAQGIFYMILVFLVEFGVISRVRYLICNRDTPVVKTAEVGTTSDAIPDDDDVEEERRRINKTAIDSLLKTDSLLLRNLNKSYGSYSAVKGVCVGVPQQECFGLLGQNGAGKTSTFKMLTGDEIVTGGNAYLNGYDVKTDLKMVSNLYSNRNFSGLSEKRKYILEGAIVSKEDCNRNMSDLR